MPLRPKPTPSQRSCRGRSRARLRETPPRRPEARSALDPSLLVVRGEYPQQLARFGPTQLARSKRGVESWILRQGPPDAHEVTRVARLEVESPGGVLADVGVPELEVELVGGEGGEEGGEVVRGGFVCGTGGHYLTVAREGGVGHRVLRESSGRTL